MFSERQERSSKKKAFQKYESPYKTEKRLEYFRWVFNGRSRRNVLRVVRFANTWSITDETFLFVRPRTPDTGICIRVIDKQKRIVFLGFASRKSLDFVNSRSSTVKRVSFFCFPYGSFEIDLRMLVPLG